MIPVVGVDPGGATTGVIGRAFRGEPVFFAQLVVNSDAPELRATYLREVVVAVGDAMKAARALDDRALLAVEGLVHPNPHMGLANVKGLLDTAQVLGALRLAFKVVVVPPGGNGSAPIGSYPRALVGDDEPKGTGKLRHARSAWDVAGLAKTIAALR